MKSEQFVQQSELSHSLNECLYNSIILTAAGTLISSFVVFASMYGKSDLTTSICWVILVNTVYAARVIDSRLFSNDERALSRSEYWKFRYAIGSFLASAAWGTCIWLVYPQQDLHYAALLVIALSAVSASALGVSPYRTGTLTIFLAVMGGSLIAKLILTGEPFATALAVYSLIIYCFLISSGFRISKNFNELLRMKLDTQNANLTMVNITENMAKMGYWSWPLDAEKIDLSDSLCRLLRLDNRQVSVKEVQQCIHKDDESRVLMNLDALRTSDQAEDQVSEYRLDPDRYGSERFIRQFARQIKNADGSTVLFGSVQDITQFRNAERKIYHMAFFDHLTELANRAHFLEKLEEQIKVSSADHSGFALLYIDIDNFKEVNDSFGHKHGDQYLKVFAQYLSDVMQPDHFVARLGGDEFCVLLRSVHSSAEALGLTVGLEKFRERKLKLGPYMVRPQFSVGIAVYPEHGVDQDELVKHADLAMYNAKNLDGAGVAVYSTLMSAEVSRRRQLESDIRKAIVNDEFELWYQPKVDMDSRTLSGFEALIRWRKDGEVISPDHFIPLAETVGLIESIGDWVLDRASDQLIYWNRLGHKTSMAVNISSGHFSSDNFLNTINELLQCKDIAPGDLEIEITESLSRDSALQSRVSGQLKSLGLRVAIDDFGTGYSSLSVLPELAADTLKIDQSFVRKLPLCEESRILVTGIIDMARGLGFSIVAEGVETPQQFDFLAALGCHYAQGYYMSKPVPAAEALVLLENGLPVFNQHGSSQARNLAA